MFRRRRHFVGQEWAYGDVRWVFAIALPLFLSAFYPAFIWVALATALALVTLITVRVVRKRRRERANADAPFWADQIRD